MHKNKRDLHYRKSPAPFAGLEVILYLLDLFPITTIE